MHVGQTGSGATWSVQLRAHDPSRAAPPVPGDPEEAPPALRAGGRQWEAGGLDLLFTDENTEVPSQSQKW